MNSARGLKLFKGKSMALRSEEYVFKTLSPAIRSKFEFQLLKMLVGRLEQMNGAMARQKEEFQQFPDAFEHIKKGIRSIMETCEEISMIQNLSDSHFRELRK